ncbi:Signal transduction histidine-protein kinase/phosphatase MprB [Baekduia alba]|uniref:sensor histidine kinase n=1 Tax=Baekduia alba TaxID=2997333 RepID=UPI0023404C49|nr:HAMP domain-containing sensor histidine kinase [Baekduia alba]WCB95071.1 Signal transduction histidine-protein kinase/phosphatase MprB [Baekduia alba]
MTFRRRIVLLAAAAVAVAIAGAVTITYTIVRHDLRASVDGALRETNPQFKMITTQGKVKAQGMSAPVPGQSGKHAAPAGAGPLDNTRVQVPNQAFGAAKGIAQATLITGQTILPDTPAVLPVTAAVRDVAAGRRAAFLRDEDVGGVHLRVLTRQGPNGEALQIARPLTDADATLGRLRWLLAAVMLGGVALAAGLGFAVSRAATRPLARLTATAERVTATGDLRHRIPQERDVDDEPNRLATAFNGMLAALAGSRDAQRQLVADASHELRTPLTAIRANVELLGHAPDLPRADRDAMLASARSQLEDLTVLVGDLVDLARPGDNAGGADPPEDLRLDELVNAAVERARRHAPPGTTFTVAAEPTVVHATRARLARAVGNLLDNAVKWSPPDGAVEVVVRPGEVTVRDHGPGIAEVDLPHVFDRFYRAPSARGLPGSGLGLAIVKHVADAHRGTVRAERAPGGGTVLRLTLPA